MRRNPQTFDRSRWAIVVGIVACLAQIGVERLMRDRAIDGVYFQRSSSEHLVQTVSIVDLRASPFESIWNLHIQPPMLDVIRAAVARLWSDTDPQALLRHVDETLYLLWAGLNGVMAGIVFHWLSGFMRARYALAATVIWAAHPASIIYTTLLDATLLSTVLILWMFYSLWQLSRRPQRSLVPFTIVTMLLFLTRSLFQWPAFVVFAVALVVLGVVWRRVVTYLLICGALSGLYLTKQYVKFGLLSTASMTSLMLTHSVGLDDRPFYRYLEDTDPSDAPVGLPAVLTRKYKLDGSPNLNHVNYLKGRQYFISRYETYMTTAPVRDILRNYRNSFWLYLAPSQWYTPHVIGDRIPWRRVYEVVFSYPVLVVLLAAAGARWLVATWQRSGPKPTVRVALALLLPLAYIVTASIVGDGGENMRYKFFIEPVLFVFVVAECHAAAASVKNRGFRYFAL